MASKSVAFGLVRRRYDGLQKQGSWLMKQKWRQNLSHYEEFARMAAAANYHQNHVSRQLKHNCNNDGL